MSISSHFLSESPEEEEEEEEEIYLAQTQQIKCKYKSYTIQLSRLPENPKVNYAGHPHTSTS